ncbi:MAG: hypothetical protein D6814_13905 [Calditrichaeota bacterium]|nr:MAG: hypothetical protein D6814_13905 [Calditrichota bacterium]
MELFTVLLIIVLAWAFFKIFAIFFNLAAFALIWPIKLFALALAGFLVIFLLIPLGFVAGIAGLVLAPLAILIPLLPFLLIGAGIFLVLKHRTP